LILSVHVLDDQSGMKDGHANLSGPAGASMKDVRILPQNLTNGTPRDGLYIVKMEMPGVAGEWILEDLMLADATGNQIVLERADLLRMGLPSGFLVA
jgi:FixJ family two-component response regulator